MSGNFLFGIFRHPNQTAGVQTRSLHSNTGTAACTQMVAVLIPRWDLPLPILNDGNRTPLPPILCPLIRSVFSTQYGRRRR